MSLYVFSERKSSKERALTKVIPAMEPARIAMRSVVVVTYPNKRHKRIIIVETNAASAASRRFFVLILVIRTFEMSIISVAKSRNHNCFSIFSSLFFVKKMNCDNTIITEKAIYVKKSTQIEAIASICVLFCLVVDFFVFLV
jgi:hypothetical protein